MITLKLCPICRSTNINLIRYVIETPDVVYKIMPRVNVNAAIISRFSLCRDCNLIFQNPRLSDKDLDLYYSRGYYRSVLSRPIKKADGDELSRARIDEAIINEQIGKVSAHLDVGCSRGYLLDLVSAKVGVGVESNIGYVRVKSAKVYTSLEKVPRKLFDLVTAIHVLEHLPYPHDFLEKIVKFVKNGGHVVVEVPTWKSPGGSLRLAHLYHFEPDVLRSMCRQVGLKVIHTEFTPHLLLICKKGL